MVNYCKFQWGIVANSKRKYINDILYLSCTSAIDSSMDNRTCIYLFGVCVRIICLRVCVCMCVYVCVCVHACVCVCAIV